MAPSQSDHTSAIHDPILAARLEAIGQLAGALTERVGVIDHQFNLLYANNVDRSEDVTEQRNESKCYQIFAHRADACDVCPAVKVLNPS